MPADYLFLYALWIVQFSLLIIFKNDGQRLKKQRATFSKNTGNVFQNHRQCFLKRWATKNNYFFFKRYSSICFTKSSRGKAPIDIIGLPSFGIKRKVGMLWMPKAAANSFS